MNYPEGPPLGMPGGMPGGYYPCPFPPQYDPFSWGDNRIQRSNRNHIYENGHNTIVNVGGQSGNNYGNQMVHPLMNSHGAYPSGFGSAMPFGNFMGIPGKTKGFQL